MTRTLFATALLTSLLVYGCGGANAGNSKGGARAFPVAVEEIKPQRVEYTVSAVGSVEARLEVQISSRVSGVLEAVHFMEGTHVTPETVLAEIEPRRFKLAKDAAAAAYQRAQAEMAEAEAGLKRRETGTATPGERPSIFSKEEVEVWRTRVNVAKANEAERKAELDRAALEYENCYIKAPVPGVIERKMVQLGEWLQPGRQIALIVKTDELLLRFFVPEDEAISLKTGMAAHFTVLNASRTYEAKLIHVAAYADQTSRMVEVIAEVSKVEDGNLTPGAFARVTVPFGSNDNAATVNETAIRPSERGFLVFVIGEDNKAHEREIETGLRTADGRIEVTKGLKVGEKVVTAGAEALRDGADVSISSESEGSDK